MNIIKVVSLNFRDNIQPILVDAKQGNIGTTYIKGIPIGITGIDELGVRVFASIIRPDGSPIYATCILLDGDIYIPLSGSTLSVVGNAKYSVEVMWIDGRVATSFDGVINIEESIVDSDAIESSDEFSALQRLLQEIRDAFDAIETSTTMPPIFGDNGNWWVWDTDTGKYVDTGKSFMGEQGIQGEPGEGITPEDLMRITSLENSIASLDEILQGNSISIVGLRQTIQSVADSLEYVTADVSSLQSTITNIQSDNTATWVLLNDVDNRSRNNATDISSLKENIGSGRTLLKEIVLEESVYSLSIDLDFPVEDGIQIIVIGRGAEYSAVYYTSFNMDRLFTVTDTNFYTSYGAIKDNRGFRSMMSEGTFTSLLDLKKSFNSFIGYNSFTYASIMISGHACYFKDGIESINSVQITTSNIAYLLPAGARIQIYNNP